MADAERGFLVFGKWCRSSAAVAENHQKNLQSKFYQVRNPEVNQQIKPAQPPPLTHHA